MLENRNLDISYDMDKFKPASDVLKLKCWYILRNQPIYVNLWSLKIEMLKYLEMDQNKSACVVWK